MQLGDNSKVCAVGFSSDGHIFASASWTGSIRLWDPATGDQLLELKGRGDRILRIAFCPGSPAKTLASYSVDKAVRLWDVPTGVQRDLLEFDDHVHSMVFSPGGLLACGSGKDALLWSESKRRVLQTIRFPGKIRVQEFDPDPKANVFLITDPKDGLTFWDYSNNKPIKTLFLEINSGVVAFSSDKKLLAHAGPDFIDLCDLTTGELVRRIHWPGCRQLSFVPSKPLLACCNHTVVLLWNTKNHQESMRIELGKYVTGIPFPGDGQLLATCCNDFSTLWDLHVDSGLPRPPIDEMSSISYCASSADGSKFALMGRGLLSVLNAATGREVHKVYPQDHQPKLSPDGRWLIYHTLSHEKWKEIAIVDLTGSTKLWKISDKAIGSTAFSQDSSLLAVAFCGRTVGIWSLADRASVGGGPYTAPWGQGLFGLL
jgi:WD40 repeat protein